MSLYSLTKQENWFACSQPSWPQLQIGIISLFFFFSSLPFLYSVGFVKMVPASSEKKKKIQCALETNRTKWVRHQLEIILPKATVSNCIFWIYVYIRSLSMHDGTKWGGKRKSRRIISTKRLKNAKEYELNELIVNIVKKHNYLCDDVSASIWWKLHSINNLTYGKINPLTSRL